MVAYPLPKLPSTLFYCAGSERLDYIEDFDDFATPKAVNMEWFEIPGEGLFVATANPSRNISYILKWSGGKFVNYQEIPESNVTSWKFFRVDSKVRNVFVHTS